MKLEYSWKLKKYAKSGFTIRLLEIRAGPVNTNLGPGPVNTNLGLGPVNTV